jgi:hypothetical protein
MAEGLSAMAGLAHGNNVKAMAFAIAAMVMVFRGLASTKSAMVLTRGWQAARSHFEHDCSPRKMALMPFPVSLGIYLLTGQFSLGRLEIGLDRMKMDFPASWGLPIGRDAGFAPTTVAIAVGLVSIELGQWLESLTGCALFHGSSIRYQRL